MMSSIGRLVATPQRNEERVKIPTQARRKRLRPILWPSQAVLGMTMALEMR
jgi:hypothetical protein